MKKTKIVCTIGPASESKEIFSELVKNGLNVARLNFSHGSHEEHQKRIDTIKEVREELKKPVALMLDTKGPEIRTGKFSKDVITLVQGDEFTLVTYDYLGDQNKCQVSYEGLAKDVEAGDRILIDDGLIELKVIEKNETEIRCLILNGGDIKDNKGVNVPGVSIRLPAITEKDTNDILFGIKNDMDFIAASFIRKADDVLAIRKILENNGGEKIHIISKIENQEGVDNLDEILEVSDGIMVARGDLGVEIPTEEVPIVQKMMIRKCNIEGKPVITATQMLDSMIRNPRPTRAEATDVANAIFDGTDAIMLSGETAAGKYPVESVKTMAVIAEKAENAIDYNKLLEEKSNIIAEKGVTFAVSHATCTTANDLEASAIITCTASGFTARKVAKFRPKAPIIASCTSEQVRRKINLVWGVFSVLVDEADSTDEMFDMSVSKSKDCGYIKPGDLIIFTAGVPVGVAGATNLMKVELVGENIITGTGIGKKLVKGVACVALSAEECASKFKDGDILVTNHTDKDMMEYIEKASGLVIEEGGYTSHGAIVGLTLKIPTVIGAALATECIKDGELLTVDSSKGIVYLGVTRLL